MLVYIRGGASAPAPPWDAWEVPYIDTETKPLCSVDSGNYIFWYENEAVKWFIINMCRGIQRSR